MLILFWSFRNYPPTTTPSSGEDKNKSYVRNRDLVFVEYSSSQTAHTPDG